MVQELKLETLSQLVHGKVGVACNREIKRVISDCIDRPSDDRPRTVTLKLAFIPSPMIDGQSITCEGAKAVAKVSSKLPDYETQEIDLGVRENGSAVFAPNAPENHMQHELFNTDEEEG